MSLYFQVIQYSALRLLTYPFEVIATIIQRALEVGFLILFWSIIHQSNASVGDAQYLFGYFLIGGGITEINMTKSMHFGMKIAKANQRGLLSNYMIRPISIIGYIYSEMFGERLINTLVGLLSIILGVILIGPTSTMHIIAFTFMSIIAVILGSQINMIVALASFYIIEVGAFRYIMQNVVRVFAGYLVPLSLFPAHLYTATIMTPFAYTIYFPIKVLNPTTDVSEIPSILLVAIVWVIILFLFIRWAWNKIIKRYEAVGQ